MRANRMITGVILAAVIGAGIGFAALSYVPSGQGGGGSSTSVTSTSYSSSSINTTDWTISGCGVQTITSATTHTAYYADTTYTTTLYYSTPNQIETGSTFYDSGWSTYETLTEYSADTTSSFISSTTTTYTTTESLGCVIIHLNISVSYSGAWNGTYSYGCCSPNGLMPVAINGTGPRNVSATFQGNVENEICYSVHIQKDDSSLGVLKVASDADYFGSYGNSTSVPFGNVEWQGCMIS